MKKGTKNPKFAKPNGQEIWVMLLEKAWAKVNGGFANIVGGDNQDSYYALTGFTSDKYPHSTTAIDDLWQKLSTANMNNEIMAAATPQGVGTEEQLTNGIVLGHAYSLIGTVQFYNSNKLIRLVQLRNPWGKHEWNGDWSDSSSLWTPELKTSINLKDFSEDGIFFMAVEDYVKAYSWSEVCHVKYGNTVKSINIKGGDDLSYGNIFNLVLDEDSTVVFSTFLLFWRVTRPKNPNKSIIMLLASYDSNGSLTFITSANVSSKSFAEISTSLKKGNYVMWVYNTNYTLPDPKPDHYIVRFLSTSSKVNFQKVGLDYQGKVIRKLMDVLLGDNKDVVPDSNGLLQKRGNTFPNLGLGYTRITNPSTSGVVKKINMDLTKSLNISYLTPYDKNTPSALSFSLPSGSSFIMLGTMVDSTLSYLFNLSPTVGNLKTTESTVDFVDKIDVSPFLLTGNKLPTFTSDYFTTFMDDALTPKSFRVSKKRFLK